MGRDGYGIRITDKSCEKSAISFCDLAQDTQAEEEYCAEK